MSDLIKVFLEPDELYAAILDKTRKLGISQRELARQLDISPSGLSRLKRGGQLIVSSYILVVQWLVEDINCLHGKFIVVGGVGTKDNPPAIRRICLDCGENLSLWSLAEIEMETTKETI